MPNSGPDITLQPSAGNTQFSVSVPSGAPATVNFFADNTGYTILASVAPGGSATFYAPAGFFFTQSVTNSYYTVTAVQAFQNAVVVNNFIPSRAPNLLTNSTLGQNIVWMVPFDVVDPVNALRLNQYVSLATVFSASNATGSCGLTMSAALYSKGTGANSDTMYTFWSNSVVFGFSNSSNSNLTVSQPVGLSTSVSTTFAATNASTWLATSLGGFREVVMPVGLTIQPGRYWFAVAQSSTSANASFLVTANYMQETLGGQINFQPFGGNSSASNASYPMFNENLGYMSATQGSFPATVPVTGGFIIGAPTATVPYFNFSGFATNASEG